LTSLRRLGVDDILPALRRLLQFDPPPNQYGIRFLEGLATRDAKWLLKLAKDKKNGGLSPRQLRGLLSIAVEKLSAYTRKLAQEPYIRGGLPTETWLVLCQAVIAASDERLSEVLQLARDYPSVYEFRKFQVPSAVKLRDFAIKQRGELPNALRDWIDELTKLLVVATAEEPGPPNDFRRKSETGCDCKFCRQLSRFLSDPAQQQTNIPAAEYHRNHLEQVIHERRLDVATKTVKLGRPYSLGLTKTTASHEADVQRFRNDLKLLDSLRLPEL